MWDHKKEWAAQKALFLETVERIAMLWAALEALHNLEHTFEDKIG